MERFRRLIEIGSNVAIVVVAILLGYSLLTRQFAQPIAPPPSAAESQLKPGTRLPIASVDFSKSEKNLLLVLSTTCKYCTESAAFYQRLAKQNAETKKLNIVAALPQEVAESAKYIDSNGFVVDQIIKASPSELLVRGTPTLVLLDKNGTVLESWAGKLPPEKEKEVAERLFGSVVVAVD